MVGAEPLLLLMLACGDAPEEPPQARPVAAAAAPRVGEGQDEPVPPDRLRPHFPGLHNLAPYQQLNVLDLAQVVPAPCAPCEGTSLARCLDGMAPNPGPPAGCENLPSLARRAVRLATLPRDELRLSISYNDVWVALPADRPLTGAADPVVDIWVDPASPFLSTTLDVADKLPLDQLGYRLRYLPRSEGQPLARAAIAAEAQGRALPYLRMVSESRPRGGEHSWASPVDLARKVEGMDITALEAALASPDLDQRLTGDRELAARLQLRSAPVWYIDGYRFVGQQSERSLRRAWELAIADRRGG